jgi:hypothetical protein
MDSFDDDSNIDWGRSDHLFFGGGGDVLINCTNDTSYNPNLVGLWHFDEGSGTIAYDRSTNGHNGILGGDGVGTDQPAWTTGKYGKALSFDGVDDYVEVVENNSLDISGAISVEAWIKFKGSSTYSSRCILAKCWGGGYSRGGYIFHFTDSNTYSDGNFRLVFQKTNGNPGEGGGNYGSNTNWDRVVSEKKDWLSDVWYHVVGVWDGTTNTDSLKIYINGSLDATHTPNIKATSILANDYPLHIGNLNYSSPNGQFDGEIDEVAIYDIALTHSEIKYHHKNGSGFQLFKQANLTSKPIALPAAMNWDTLIINKFQPGNTFLNVTILDASNNQPIPGSSTYIVDGEFDISYIDRIQYPTIKLNATFAGNGLRTPRLYYWGVSWNASHTWCDTLFGGKKIESSNNVELLEGMVQFRNSSNLISTSINISNNYYYKTLIINKLEPDGGYLNATILNASSNTGIAGFINLTDTSIDLSGIDQTIYPSIKVKATYSSGGLLGRLYYWSVKMVSPPVQIRPLKDKNTAMEDEEYYMQYWNFGYNTVTTWIFKSNAPWLAWDPVENRIYGTPNNGEVNSFWVQLNITDGLGNFDEHNFNIDVNNTPPKILTENLLFAIENRNYYIDYNSNDDGQGTISWYLDTEVTWLRIDQATGELSGIATNEIFNSYLINITVDDGNGGVDSTEFELSMYYNPVIITENVTSAFENEYYSVDYNATDIDGDNVFEWYLETNASWLGIEKDSGLLYGTPKNEDVGFYFVNVTVKDSREGSSSQNFSLEVINVNDPPMWVDVPKYTTIKELGVYYFDVNATDIDMGDTLEFDIYSEPEIDITIDPATGIIEWTAIIEDRETSSFNFDLTISVTDGEVMIWTNFVINVIPNLAPTVSLDSPQDNALVNTSGIELIWSGSDEENDPIRYEVFLSKNVLSVSNRLEVAKVVTDFNETSFRVENLEVGGTYYWTVIPYDVLQSGICLDDLFIFVVNTPPIVVPISDQKVIVGTEFFYEILGSDFNNEDTGKLVYSLEIAPTGMTIDSSTGLIKWTPTKEQLGRNIVKIQVSDGKDMTTQRFEIDVIKKSTIDSDSPAADQSSFFAIGISFVVIVIIMLFIVFILLKRRRKHIRPDVEYIPPHKGVDSLQAGTTSKPGEISAGTVIIDQVEPVSQQTQIQPSPTPGQIPSIPIPKVTKAPQLPPAAVKTAKTEPQPQPVSTIEPTVTTAEPVTTTVLEPEQEQVPIPVHIPEVESEPPDVVEEEPETETDFGLEGGPKPVQKDGVEHDVFTPPVVEEVDIGEATKDLQAATVVKPNQEEVVIHKLDTGVWRPGLKSKVSESKEVLEQLEKLVDLKSKGVLTEEEFEKRKKELLG